MTRPEQLEDTKQRDYATLFDLMDEWLEQHPNATDDEAFEAVCWRNTKGALKDDNEYRNAGA